jgi:hypothetical protein
MTILQPNINKALKDKEIKEMDASQEATWNEKSPPADARRAYLCIRKA